MALPPANISLTAPFTQAINRCKMMLFQPFDMQKWFVIGFCAWLAQLGEGGGFNGGGGNFGSGPGHGGTQSFREILDQTRHYIAQNLYWLLPLTFGVVLVCLLVGLLILWLNSRGKFMFLHCVALNKAEVRVPWYNFARQANSLFWFRLVLGLVASVLILPLIAGILILVLRMVFHQAASPAGIFGTAVLTLVLIAFCIAVGLISKFTKDFIVPIQFLRGQTTQEGWHTLLPLLSANASHFVLYVLFQLLLGIGIALGIFAVVIATCCIAGCLFMIPYLGTVALLPVFTFQRSYSLYYLAQYGPEYDVFLPVPAALGTSPR